LGTAAARLHEHLTRHPAITATQVAHTLAGRPTYDHRAVILGSSRTDLLAALHAVATDPAAPPTTGPIRGRRTDGGTAFLLPGQGSHHPGMGRRLHAAHPTFARTLDETCSLLDAQLRGHFGARHRPLRDVMFAGPAAGPANLLDHTAYTQAALFAYQTALYRLLAETYGLTPDYLVGHSIGELSAAHLAGVLTLPDACVLVAARGYLLHTLPPGAMIAIEASEAELEPHLDVTPGRAVTIAALNAPRGTVISGDPAATAALARHFAGQGRRTIPLHVAHAFHSPHTDAILDTFRQIAQTLTYHPATIPIITNVTGKPAAAGELQDPTYWTEHIRRPVRYSDAVNHLRTQHTTVYLELTARPTLTPLTHQNVPESGDALIAATSRPGGDGPADLLTALAHVGARTATGVRWPADPRHRVDLPTHPFQHRSYWLPSSTTAPATTSTHHPLAGTTVHLADDQLVLTGEISQQTHPWLADHVLADAVLLPGTVFVELALYAAEQTGCDRVEELILEAPLVLSRTGTVQLQVKVDAPDGSGRRGVAIHSRPRTATGQADPWTRHAAGAIAPAPVDGPTAVPTSLAGAWPPADAVPVDVADVYRQLAAHGYTYGPAFQGLRAAWRCGDSVYAEAALPEELHADAGGYSIHPALLDVALQPFALTGMLGAGGEDRIRLPFSCTGLRRYAAGATTLRVKVSPAGTDSVTLTVADPAGTPIAEVESLTLRPADPRRFPPPPAHQDGVHQIQWRALAATAGPSAPAGWVVLDRPGRLGEALAAAGGPVPAHHDGPAALRDAVRSGTPAPAVVVATVPPGDRADLPGSVRAATGHTLALVQALLASSDLAGTRLVVVTDGAVAAEPGDHVRDLAHAAVWGLVRTAQSEHPGRFALVDLDRHDASPAALAAAVASGEPQLAVRAGRLLAPRLARSAPAGELTPPDGGPAWRLAPATSGTPDQLTAEPWDEGQRPLAPGQVRVGLRAAGLNFRDALVALHRYPGPARLGLEGAGVVTEVAPDVTRIVPGDRMMGLFDGIGPVGVTDHRLLVRVPDGWSFTQAATAPVAFLTAWHGLADLARIRAGETLLVHAATGGVGMAALQLARHWGVEVYGTASTGKWAALRAAGLDQHHIANSRTLDFAPRVRGATGGRGVDVVLNALAGEFTDASLGLLAPGGRFIEMGKADSRDAGAVAASHPGITYRAFDLLAVPPDRLQEILTELGRCFAAGTLRPLPVTAWDVRDAPAAMRHLAHARHTGKLALTLPTDLDRDGTVLVTGGTGTLGALTARHLAARHGARHLLLASRSGPAAGGAAGLSAELAALGADATIAACDTADPDALAALLDTIPVEHPLTAVIHAAGVLDDATVEALTPGRLAEVLRAKVDTAWHLHRLTRHHDLSAFVLFSSVAGTLGTPGQASYAAANAFLDALAHARRVSGSPAVSLVWGLWEHASGMTGHLTGGDRARLRRHGIVPMATGHALSRFDTALAGSHPAPVLASLATTTLRAHADELPPILLELVRTARGTPAASPDLGRQLAGRSPAEQQRMLLDLVNTSAVMILGHADPAAISPADAFKDLGFDSLTAVELRNRLAAATGLRLPATLTFDHPTPAALATHLRTTIAPGGPSPSSLTAELDRLGAALSDLPPEAARQPTVRSRLHRLLWKLEEKLGTGPPDGTGDEHRDFATDEELFAALENELGPPRSEEA
jgi:NADPH:quinone reductase-like Zn-dependent oxidoreductase/malonyl CoA-acyl carrier protein transacylase/acyl carrier protein